MVNSPATVLIVDADPAAARALASEARARAYQVRTASCLDEAFALMGREQPDAVLVDLAPGAENAFDLLPRLTRFPTDTDVLVMSSESSTAAAIQWFDPEAFAFVAKTDIVQVFAALARLLERRRITVQNRRLVWELQTLNEIEAGIARSLVLDDVLTGALQRLIRAMDASGGSIRLRDESTGAFEPAAVVGPPALRALWRDDAPKVLRPSDQVIATRTGTIVEDFGALPKAEALEHPLPLRSAISVPLVAGTELLGTLSLGAASPGRFDVADQRLLSSIASHLVVAIQNVRLHQTVRRGKAEWEATFDAISDPIAVFSDRGELLRGNLALAEHMAVPLTALRHLTCDQTPFCGQGVVPCACGAPGYRVEERCRRDVTLPDGRIFSVTAFPVATAGQRASVVQVAKNVTEEIRSARRLQQMSRELAAMNDQLVAAMRQLKATQAQLVQAEKLSAMGHLVAGVAHELNNPLTTVIGYAQLVEDDLRDDSLSRPLSDVAIDVRRIAEESERAAGIVRNLLSFARRQSAARVPEDLALICTRTLALREYEFRARRIELSAELPPGLPLVMADAGQLQQVLLNLVLNAEHAMRAAATRRLAVAARYDETCDAVELSVTDTGHGIDALDLPRLFDPFFTTRPVGEGTGLGLSICYGIIRDHGGSIAVTSTSGAGTTFQVTLPARRADQAAGGDVLVAHGDQSERDFIAAVFSGWGYRPHRAATLADALTMVGASPAQIVVVDRHLVAGDPDTWGRLRLAGIDRIIAISPSLDDPDIERAGRDGRISVAVSPVDLRSLHGAIRAWVIKEPV